MKQPQAMEYDVSQIVEQGETAIQVLGGSFLSQWNTSKDIRQSIVVLTERNLYQVGTFFEPDGKGDYQKKRGQNTVSGDAFEEYAVTDIPVGQWTGILGGAILGIGFILLVWGIIDGSIFGMVMGLFVGAVWMMVPGALMLVHWKTGARRFIDVTHAGGQFAFPVTSLPDEELEKLGENLTALSGRS